MALLAVSFCLIFFIVKFLRKKSALEVAGMEGNHLAKNLVSTINSASMISSNIPLRYPIQGHLNESESQTQKEQLLHWFLICPERLLVLEPAR